jgi:hypothetical protein
MGSTNSLVPVVARAAPRKRNPRRDSGGIFAGRDL